MNAVLKGPACALDSIPAALRRTLDRGAKALERAELVRPRRTRMLHAKAKHLLERARRSALRASGGEKPKLSAGCAESIADIADVFLGTL